MSTAEEFAVFLSMNFHLRDVDSAAVVAEGAAEAEEAKAAEKEAKKQLRKIKWQKGVEKVKKIIPWVGYSVAAVVSGIAVGAISEAVKKNKS